MPFVSVIVPCRNEEQFIGRCLDAILANDYPSDRFEVLVVDGMSEDGTREVVSRYQARYPWVQRYDNPKKIIPCALNLGLARARGDVIIRMDAHAVCPRTYISECVRLLDAHSADSVGGRLRTLPRTPSPMGNAIAKALSVPFGVGNSNFRVQPARGDQPRTVDTVLFGCWRRELLDRIGGWNEKLARSEDVELSRRLAREGGRMLMVPSLVCDYYARSELRALVRHAFGNGRWAILPFKYARGMPVAVRHLVPLVFVTALLLGAVLAVVSHVSALLFAVLIGVYALASLGSAAMIAFQERDARYMLLMPVVFGALHVAYGLGSLVAVGEVLVARRQRDEASDVDLLGLRATAPPTRETPWPRVSIVIPCRNERQFIGPCLESILANDYPRDLVEIVVVDGMSEDGTRDVLNDYRRRHPNITVLDNPRREQQIALNIAITAASGDVVVRMDAHSRYKRNYVTECVRALREYRADNVGGRWITVPREDTLVGRAICLASSTFFGVGNAYYRLVRLDGRGSVLSKPKWDINVAYFCCRREIFDTIGLFDERLDRSEDLDFRSRLRRAGYRTLFVPTIESSYLIRSRYVDFVRHAFQNGLWVLLPLKYVPRVSFSLRHVVPLGFVLALLAGAMLSLVGPLGRWLLAGVGSSYVLLSFYFSTRIAWREGEPRYALVLPFIFLSLHVAYGAGSIVGLGRLLGGGSTALHRPLPGRDDPLAASRDDA